MRPIIVFLGVVFLAGCASTHREIQKIEVLEGRVDSLSQELELSRQESSNLKKELSLFKKEQQVDTERFVTAQAAFETAFSEDVKTKDVGVDMTDRGMIIIIDAEKLFVSASDGISDSGKQFLDRISEFINQYFPTNYIYIEGHTDNQSLAVFEWKSDWDFSFARALNVLKYFTEKKGVDPLRLSASGFGQYRPRASNDTKEGRRLNRRIEIIISSQRTAGQASGSASQPVGEAAVVAGDDA